MGYCKREWCEGGAGRHRVFCGRRGRRTGSTRKWYEDEELCAKVQETVSDEAEEFTVIGANWIREYACNRRSAKRLA